MKTKNYVSTLCLAFITFSLFGQLTEVTDYEKKLSYTEFETAYYSVDKNDVDKISLPDMVKMKELIYERDFEKTINSKGERTTIIKHISSKNVYEDWMEEPEILVIDKDAVSSYTFSGERVNRIAHSPKHLKLAENVGDDLLPYFITPTQNQLKKMEEAGMKIEDLGDGFMKMTFGGNQQIYNEKLLYKELNSLNNNGEIMHSVKIKYMELPSGELVVSSNRESTVVVLDNNIKAKHISNKFYSNYTYEESDTDDEIEIQVLDVKSLANNSRIQVEYKVFSNKNTMHVSVYNISGRIVKKETVENSGLNQLSIQDLSPGIYIISIQSAGKTLNGKFIKL